MKTSKVIFGLMYLLIVSCGPKQGMDRLTQKAKIEGKAGAEGQVEYENQRSKEMEKDLERKFSLYSSLEGTYEGILTTERGDFQVRLTMVPSLSKLKMKRPRTREEIVTDLTNLSMNTQVIQWRESSPNSAIGCMVTQIRPDFNRLTLNIASESCPSLYSFAFSMMNEAQQVLTSDEVYEHIDSGIKIFASDIRGEIKPNTNARIYPISLKKVIGGIEHKQ